VRGLANSKRSTAPSNGMDAKSSAGVPLSSPAAAQRCAEGAGLDSGAPAEAQSAMPSIAALTIASTADHLSPTPLPSMAPQLQSRISTSLADVTVQPVHPRLDQLLQPLQQDAVASDPEEDRSLCHPLGAPQVQTVASEDQGRARLV
jgi:hypothetical protein